MEVINLGKNYVKAASDQVREMIMDALGAAVAAGELPAEPVPAFTVEVPGDTSHGDFAANVAMVSARAFRCAPRRIAEAVLAHLSFEGSWFTRAECAGPGFLNFFLSPGWFASALSEIGLEKDSYGRSDYGRGKKVMVEFVSANPTGPMHMGNARGGALGDCLASALDAAGYDVTREFYINDAGNQIEKFGISLEARYLQLYLGEENAPLPEDAYQGLDILEHAKAYAAIHGDSLVNAEPAARRKALVDYALPLNIAGLKRDLGKYRIEYDVWFPESRLHSDGTIDKILALLKDRGMTYEKDGALWLKLSSDDESVPEAERMKDEVLVRANGIPTYFAADIAYHYNKFAVRGFDRVIDVWGADHHGHVARMKKAMDAVGLDGNALDIVLMQLVRLMKDGQPFRMSKRTGKSITLNDLIDEVPVDAARFFFNLREPNSTFDFDLDLAVEQSSQNPVYYVQYAHARICSILRNLKNEGVEPRACSEAELLLLTAPEETALIRLLAAFPGEIVEAARCYDPARLTRYAVELASSFHKFYNACRVKGEDEALMQARLTLCLAVRTTLKNDLTLLKIDAPESM
ncbi:MAG: arginine--tRNA ligase [Oscillospiraceae bacterium]|nr:arginine--tRNA ligase [Oscillospiraceae bacterium]